MLNGYHGRYLHIDLTRNESRSVSLPETVLRQFLGGSGLGVYLLLSEAAAKVDPTSPESSIAFIFSPLVGSPLTTSAKFAVVCKSPLTGRINDALASSGFAVAGKRSGCDALVITGRATVPSLVVIDGGQVTVQPAGDLWGTTCSDTQTRLRHRFDDNWQFAVIGPAGEQQVRYATISHDGRHAGRGGSGAVLGAKNVKAIVVRGRQRVRWARPEELSEYARQLSRRSFGPATAKYRELGTAANLLAFNRLKALPTRNFQQGSFDGAVDLAPETLAKVRAKSQASCVACTIGCEHIYQLASPSASSHESSSFEGQPSDLNSSGVRIEYENLFALGPLCGVQDAEVVLAASKKCDELGIDTISTGGTIAFAMECVERGLLDAPWLKFGDTAGLLRAIEEIGRRERLGDQLAEGSRRLAQRIGHDSISFAPQVKGLEIPGYEPRSLQTMALGFAVGARGADHNRSGAYEADFSDRVDRRKIAPDSVQLAVETEDKAALMDSLILCKFLRGVFEDFFAEAAEMLQLVTGWDTTADELRQTSRRIVTAKKLFNIRAGWAPAEDTLPARFFQTALTDDPHAQISKQDFHEAIRRYNLCRGWTEDGWLEEQHLRHLGLSDI